MWAIFFTRSSWKCFYSLSSNISAVVQACSSSHRTTEWFGLGRTFKDHLVQRPFSLVHGASTASLGNMHPGNRKKRGLGYSYLPGSPVEKFPLWPSCFAGCQVFPPGPWQAQGKGLCLSVPLQRSSYRPLLVVGSESLPVPTLKSEICPMSAALKCRRHRDALFSFFLAPTSQRVGMKQGTNTLKTCAVGGVLPCSPTPSPVQNKSAHTAWFCWPFSSGPGTKSDYKEK